MSKNDWCLLQILRPKYWQHWPWKCRIISGRLFCVDGKLHGVSTKYQNRTVDGQGGGVNQLRLRFWADTEAFENRNSYLTVVFIGLKGKNAQMEMHGFSNVFNRPRLGRQTTRCANTNTNSPFVCSVLTCKFAVQNVTFLFIWHVA